LFPKAYWVQGLNIILQKRKYTTIRLDGINKILQNIWSTAKEINQLKFCDYDNAKLVSDDFIPGTLIAKKTYDEENYGLFGDLIR
jgi:hypothetical protein